MQCIVTLDQEDRKYFLQALKLGLNERSVQHLEPLYEKYHKWQLETEGELRERNLKEIDHQIRSGSLGLEHFFREMSIMYDSIHALEERTKSKDLASLNISMAQTMASLFLEGTALEIMDGDVVTVPIAWLKSVLTKIPQSQSIKLFKISVLGAQSSGKSTLLNAVFGLNFPVSSGRCTSGAYMQLVKIDPELQKVLGCQYVLVIDSGRA